MDVGGDDCFLANSSSRLSFGVVDVFRESVEITIFNECSKMLDQNKL